MGACRDARAHALLSRILQNDTLPSLPALALTIQRILTTHRMREEAGTRHGRTRRRSSKRTTVDRALLAQPPHVNVLAKLGDRQRCEDEVVFLLLFLFLSDSNKLEVFDARKTRGSFLFGPFRVEFIVLVIEKVKRDICAIHSFSTPIEIMISIYEILLVKLVTQLGCQLSLENNY